MSAEDSMTPTGPRRNHMKPSDHSAPIYYDNPAWKDDAVCSSTDPELFFPEKGGPTRSAKRVCLSCPVKNECLEYALDHNERFGIWGAHSERERRAINKARGEAAA